MSSKTITIHVKGGKPLAGMVNIVSNKNAILPAIAASILTNETMTYCGVPRSPDVLNMLYALQDMGAIIDDNTATVTINCSELEDMPVPAEHIKDMQAGYLFAGPLLARFGSAKIPIASGCRLGYRGYEDHAEYLRKLGVQFELEDEKYVHFSLRDSISDQRVSVIKDDLYQDRFVTYQWPYVTPTENVLMLLAKTSRYATEISGIAQEPHVAQLTKLLRDMGAQIIGKGSTLRVHGSDTLRGATFYADPDHVDYFGFAILAAMTNSNLLLHVPTKPLSPGIKQMNEFLTEIGVQLNVQSNGVMIYGSTSVFAPTATFPKADDRTYKMNPGPAPAFPVDCLPSFIAFSTMNPNALTQTRSMNWMYTDGLTYIPALKEMGAKIINDDQRAIVQGVHGGNPYNGNATVTAPGVIEGVRAIISCALAGGNYTIKGVEYILRRNPEYFKILQELGADIEVEFDHKKIVV